MPIEVRNLKTGVIIKNLPIHTKDPCWIILSEFSETDLVQFGKNISIPYEDLEDALDEKEQPRLEIEEDIKLIKLIFHVPVDPIAENTEYTLNPIVVILYRGNIIHIFPKFDTYKKFRPITEQGIHFQSLLSILLVTLAIITKSFESMVNTLDQKIHEIENEIFKTVHSKAILNIFKLSKDVIYLGTSLRSTLQLYQQMSRLKIFKDDEMASEDLDDLRIDLDQQNKLTTIYRGLIESSLDAYASVISNNQNELIKVLTIISLVFLIPTLVASLYGMNVILPFQNEPYAFLLILIISSILIAPLYFILRLKKLL
jgi:magnesium transporter